MVQWVIFIFGSISILYLSLRLRSRHSLPRFMAFEAILGLAVLNAPYWFENPFSLAQIVSWVLLIGSAFLAVHGFRLLRIVGRPQGQFEQTTHLVMVGAYRYIRHPLYASLLYLGLGAFLKQITLLTAALALAVCVTIYATARVEESENRKHFGPAYDEYMKKTRMFIPFLF